MQIRRETLGTQVYNLLRDRILHGEVAGDTRLAQGPLSNEIGISRIPIRDALKRLESDGLVTCDEIGRYTVVPFRLQDADEVYAIRRRLEPFAVGLAVRAMTSEALSVIEEHFAALGNAERSRQLDRYIELNIKFHMAIYEASGMGRLVRIIRGLYVGVPPLTPIMLEGRLSRSQTEHEEIMRLLTARDESGAAAAMDRHIRNAGAELRKTMAAAAELRRYTSAPARGPKDHGQESN
jgi:DNA-binding GntR family transcriptional regulator